MNCLIAFSGLSMLLLVASAQPAVFNSPGGCLYNSTHCACVQSQDIGVCLRRTSGDDTNALCEAGTCQAGGYKCDCLGESICSIDTCSSWRVRNETAAKPALGATNVLCRRAEDATCLSKIEVPKEYKMVQFGPKNRALMWNMTYQTDVGDAMQMTFANGRGRGLNDNWPDRQSLKTRQINMRMYRSDDGSSQFVCAILNTWGLGNDGLGMYQARTSISSLSGQPIRFLQCDDWDGSSASGECSAPLQSTTLTAFHKGIVTHTDGWCVGPLDANGGAVSVKFSGVEKMEGINFLGSDGRSEFSFLEDGSNGLTGVVDSNGLVENGEVPEILINPAGILVE